MLGTLNQIIQNCTNLISEGGIIVGFLIVLAEAFLPVLPLGAFVTLNVNAFGIFIGLLISWIATTTGCFIAYMLFYYISENIIFKIISKKTKEKVLEKTKIFKELTLTQLVLIITLPFTPSFLINILAGLTEMPKKKYLISLLIGKSLMITFWAFIGKSFLESITNIKAIVFIILILSISYLITKIVSKKLKIE